MIKLYFNLFRVHNYIKNIFVFTPLFFDFQFYSHTITYAFIAFLCFCLLASSIYIFNDIIDLSSDRLHPIKKLRPIASRKISVKKAIILAIICLSTSLITLLIVKPILLIVALIYVILNILYSTLLKQVPVIDLIIIAIGFLLRILMGSYATDIPASNWILIMTFLLSLFLGFSKRRADFILATQRHLSIKNIAIYSLPILDTILYGLAIIICGTYLMYTFDTSVIERIGNSYVFISTFWVILGIVIYLNFIKSNITYKDPTAIILEHKKIQLILICWVLTFILLKYL